MRHRRTFWSFSAVLGFTLGFTLGLLCLAAPAEAAKETKVSKSKKPIAAATTQASKHRRAAVAPRPAYWGQNVVPGGPFYNGQDYLGDDPDPNIRSQIMRDMGRYGGPD